MRFIAKVHVLDVMDQVVVSGYVFDADDVSDPDHTVVEFTYQVPGTGQDDPITWLELALSRAIIRGQSTAPQAS